MTRTCTTCGTTFEAGKGRPPRACQECRTAPKPVHKKELTCERCSQTFLHGVGKPPRWCPECRPAARREISLEFYHQHRTDPEFLRAKADRSKALRLAKTNEAEPCSVDGCDKRANGARGMCAMHYGRVVRGADLLAPVRAKRNNVTPEGYVVQWDGKRQRGQHRVVMEQHLGRSLASWENVHHKNGRRGDNEIENLELWVTPQPKGQRPEDLAQWVIDNYRPLVQQILRGETPHMF